MRRPLLLFILLIIANGLTAQQADSLKYKYNNQTIYRYGNIFQKGTERLGFRELQFEFAMSELGLDGYQKAKKLATTSIICRLISFAASIAAISIAANNGKRNTIFIFFGGQLAFGLAAVKYNGMSRTTLDRALWQRNKDLLFPAR